MHEVQMNVGLKNYPSVAKIKIRFSVRIQPCIVERVVPKSEIYMVSPLYMISEIPSYHDPEFPRYVAEPRCSVEDSDVGYDIVMQDGKQVPDWITFGPKNKIVMQMKM